MFFLSRFSFFPYASACLTVAFLFFILILPLFSLFDLSEQDVLWLAILQDEYYQQKMFWTLTQAIISVVLTSFAAIPIAWCLAHYHFFGKTWILRLLMLPFIMPTLVAAMGVLALFGEHGLLWQGWNDTPYLLLYGNVFFNLPVMVRAIYQGLKQVPAHRLAAAQTLGASSWQQFWHIERPQILPWLMGGACLVFLYCFSGFGLALLLGGQRYATIEVEIYQLIAHELNIAHASVLVCLMLGITSLSAFVYTLLSRRSVSTSTHAKLPEKPRFFKQKCLLVLSLSLLMICCFLPLAAVIVRALSLAQSWQVLTETETLWALFNTFRFTLLTVLLAALLGLAHATAAHYLPWIRTLTFLPFMISPVCLAFGVLVIYPHYSDSIFLLISLYAVSAYPFVSKDILATWDALPHRYFSAAKILGATPWQSTTLILLPLLRPAFRRGLTLAAATAIGEFAASLFLARPEWTTLTTLIYQYLGRVGMENYDKAMVLTLVLLGIAVLTFISLDPSETH